MEVVIVSNHEQAAAVVSAAILRLLQRRADAVLGLATGSSPVPVYEQLIAAHREGTVSFAEATCFLLDEYVGLVDRHPASYRRFIREVFADHVDLPDERLHGPDGSARDLEQACRHYEAAICSAGGIDLQLLGIGTDGHIGFNEPCSSLASRTRVKTLTASTRSDNARFFEQGDEVPLHVLTQGIGTILEAKHLVLIANGEHKAEAVVRAVEGPLAARIPASALQLHPHATVVVDEAAASQLELADYYRSTYASKPSWQTI